MPPGARWGLAYRLRALGRPPSAVGRGGADPGSGRCWPRPAPGDRQHLSPPCAAKAGDSPPESAPGAPRPLRPQHSLAFPGRGLCSSLCAAPTSSAFTACTSSCSFPMARSGRSNAAAPCARRGSEAKAAPRPWPHPPPSPATRSPRSPRLGLGLGRRGAGCASRAAGGPGRGRRARGGGAAPGTASRMPGSRSCGR